MTAKTALSETMTCLKQESCDKIHVVDSTISNRINIQPPTMSPLPPAPERCSDHHVTKAATANDDHQPRKEREPGPGEYPPANSPKGASPCERSRRAKLGAESETAHPDDNDDETPSAYNGDSPCITAPVQPQNEVARSPPPSSLDRSPSGVAKHEAARTPPASSRSAHTLPQFQHEAA